MTERVLNILARAPGRGRLELWANLAVQLQIGTMLELGVWKGEFAQIMLQHVPAIGRYYMLDAWAHLDQWNKPLNVEQAKFDEVFEEAKRRTEPAGDRRILLRGRTVDVIDQIPDASLDLAYIDGDHTLRGIAIDLVAAWPKVKPGGVLGGDDFTPSIWQHNESFEPSLVFPYAVYFAEAQGAPIIALPYNQYAIVKPADGKRDFRFIDPAGRYAEHGLQTQVAKRA